MAKRNLAVLAGNGLSIAFNNALNLAAITEDLIEQLKSASDNGDKVVHAMNEIARRAEGEAEVTSEDFEKLVGAFDSQAITLDELSLLAALVESDDQHLLESIGEVAAFSQRVRDMGISYVLKTIMERSVADHERDEGLHRLFRIVLESFQGQVYFGNLNYDTLLMSALMAPEAPMCDMGTAAKEGSLSSSLCKWPSQVVFSISGIGLAEVGFEALGVGQHEVLQGLVPAGC